MYHGFFLTKKEAHIFSYDIIQLDIFLGGTILKLAIYDFDGTYVGVQTLPLLFRLWKEQRINNKAYRKYWRKIMLRYLFHKWNFSGWDKQSFRANAMEHTADLFRSVEIETLFQFLDRFYEMIQIHISPSMKAQLQKDKEEGYHTVLLSGNYDIILNPFLQEGFDQVIGTKIQGDQGLLSSKEVEIIIHERKSDAIKNHFPQADFLASKAYADSDYDLPILELVGNPVAVNPDDVLFRIAKERNFIIYQTNKNGDN